MSLVDSFAPEWKPRSNAKGPPWFDAELRRALRQRNRAWKNFKATGEGYDYYRTIRNKCSSMKLVKRKRYEDQLAVNSKVAPKRLFAYLRRRTRAESRIPLTNTNGVLETAQSKAESFAAHYSTVYLNETLPAPNLHHDHPFPWHEEPITVEEVTSHLRNINPNKSPGPDGLHPLVLKKLADILAEPLTLLFNLSLNEGRLPTEWKKAVIKPMYKSGDRCAPVNYRPVSLTCILCKVMEKIITHRIQQHLDKCQLLHPGQH